ncbi:MAG: hypothetical protein BWY43_00646 [candidate division WS2 bacterium ADurb.Bin280]|uniref:Uncharacterized protein n=1 Tax=candidate division WS2 bacterium ADurb.Bin280 TaxID=1852829 RepID=A0A1V5SC66_9BACT|nr:MAG: hypothetical protein BWY43_00646 [candidate division WS2 bacterium ADurb.Bin280]
MLKQIYYFLVQRAYAADADNSPLAGFDPVRLSFEGDNKREFLFNMLSYFLNLMPYLLGGVAFFGLLYSSIIYLSAMGDAGKIETAKKNITWIVTGIVAIAATLIIIRIIFNIVGKAIT